MNITKDIESLSLVVQWDAVEDFIDTTYTLVWSSETNHILRVVPLTEWTSYTITGLTLDTVYTIAISAANMCGQGPEFITSILLAADNTSTISSISPTVTATTNPMTIVSIAITSSNTDVTTTTTTTRTPLTTSSSTKVTSSDTPTITTTSTESTTSLKATTTTTTTTITTTTSTFSATTIKNIVSSVPTTNLNNPAGSTCKFFKHITYVNKFAYVLIYIIRYYLTIFCKTLLHTYVHTYVCQ